MTRRPFNPDCGLDIATTSIRDPEVLVSITFFGYRVVLHPEGVFYVHETYYSGDESILGIARKPAEPCAHSTKDLGVVLADMRDALEEPVLIWRDMVPENGGID